MEKSLADLLKPQEESTRQQEPEDIDYTNEAAVSAMLACQFPDVHPTPKEFFKGKVQAYTMAKDRIKLEQERTERMRRIEVNKAMWTADEAAYHAMNNGLSIGKNEGFDFIVDKHNQKVFDLLCLYFTNDPLFETYGIGDIKYSLKKGIWLQSSVRGSGKSTLLKCFNHNKRSCFGYKHSVELAGVFQKKGYDAVDPFIGTVAQPPSWLNFHQTECGFMYDELFGEDKVNHMGSPVQISQYIINRLYDFSNNHKGNFWKFHCTSNVDGSDIEKIAGLTFRSRMKDMFNLIKLEGPDRR